MKKQFLIHFGFLISLFSFLEPNVMAQMQFEELVKNGHVARFDDQALAFTPLYGGVALYSGLLKNIRFWGNFQMKDKENRLLQFHHQRRNFANDEAKDALSNLVKRFFRSQGGQFNVTQNIYDSFIPYLTPEDSAVLIADLAFLRFQQEGSPLEEGHKVRAEFESRLLRSAQLWEKQNRSQQVSEKGFELTPDKIKKQINDVRKLLQKAIEEEKKELYPVQTVEAVLLGFVVRKFEIQALDPFLGHLRKLAPFLFSNGQDSSESVSPKALQLLDQWIRLKETQKKTGLLQSPYAPQEPLISNGSASYWNRKTGQTASGNFPDCTETVLRQILNLIFYTTSGEQSEFFLPETAVSELKEFYKLQKPQDANNGERQYRDAWVRVVGDLNAAALPTGASFSRIDYMPSSSSSQEGEGDLDPGFRNALEVLIRITGLSRKSFSLSENEEEWGRLSLEAKKKDLLDQWSSFFRQVSPPDKEYQLSFENCPEWNLNSRMRGDLFGVMSVVVRGTGLPFQFRVKMTPGHAELLDVTFVDSTESIEVDAISKTEEEIALFTALEKKVIERNRSQTVKIPASWRWVMSRWQERGFEYEQENEKWVPLEWHRLWSVPHASEWTTTQVVDFLLNLEQSIGFVETQPVHQSRIGFQKENLSRSLQTIFHATEFVENDWQTQFSFLETLSRWQESTHLKLSPGFFPGLNPYFEKTWLLDGWIPEVKAAFSREERGVSRSIKDILNQAGFQAPSQSEGGKETASFPQVVWFGPPASKTLALFEVFPTLSHVTFLSEPGRSDEWNYLWQWWIKEQEDFKKSKHSKYRSSEDILHLLQISREYAQERQWFKRSDWTNQEWDKDLTYGILHSLGVLNTRCNDLRNRPLWSACQTLEIQEFSSSDYKDTYIFLRQVTHLFQVLPNLQEIKIRKIHKSFPEVYLPFFEEKLEEGYKEWFILGRASFEKLDSFLRTHLILSGKYNSILDLMKQFKRDGWEDVLVVPDYQEVSLVGNLMPKNSFLGISQFLEISQLRSFEGIEQFRGLKHLVLGEGAFAWEGNPRSPITPLQLNEWLGLFERLPQLESLSLNQEQFSSGEENLSRASLIRVMENLGVSSEDQKKLEERLRSNVLRIERGLPLQRLKDFLESIRTVDSKS